MNDKVHAFIEKHERVIKRSVAAVTFVGIVFVAVANKDKIVDSIEDDDLTDDEWEHLIGLAREMDEYVAERKALKKAH